jgi:ribosomal protein L40E
VSEKTAAADQVVKFSRKCPACGIRNFVDATVCKRCEADLLRRSTGAREVKRIRVDSGAPSHSKVRSVLILGVTLAILSVLVLSYVRPDLQALAAPGQAGVSQPATGDSEQPKDPEQENARSQESAKQVLAGLRRFQVASQTNMSYDQYNEMLTNLNAELNNTLPTFVRHDPSDERFRQEVAGAVRDYAAAGNWWKTTIKNSSVLNDADRTTRLQAEWGSAQKHLANAEKLLLQ